MTKKSDFVIEKGTLVDYIGNGKDITIPKGVTGIGGGAFQGCTGLTSITIPDSVISIRYVAFHWCSSLTRATITNTVTNIEWHAFYGCSKLTSKKGYYKAFIPTDNPNILKSEMKNAKYEVGKKKFLPRKIRVLL